MISLDDALLEIDKRRTLCGKINRCIDLIIKEDTFPNDHRQIVLYTDSIIKQADMFPNDYPKYVDYFVDRYFYIRDKYEKVN